MRAAWSRILGAHLGGCQQPRIGRFSVGRHAARLNHRKRQQGASKPPKPRASKRAGRRWSACQLVTSPSGARACAPVPVPISGLAGLPPVGPPIIGRAVVSPPIVGAPVRVVPVGGWCIVGGRVVAVPGAIVGGVAVAIVGSGAGRERPEREAADETCRKCPAAIVGSAPPPAVAAKAVPAPPPDLFGWGRSRDLLDRGHGQRYGLSRGRDASSEGCGECAGCQDVCQTTNHGRISYSSAPISVTSRTNARRMFLVLA